MHTYQTVFITLPNLTEEDERDTVETMAKIVTEGGGTFTSNDRMGRRRLAYPIRKFEDGVYTRFLYDSESAVPTELERRFRLSDNVLRYLTVTLERDWAVAAKEQAIRDAERRAEAAIEAERQAVEDAAKAAEAAEAAEQAKNAEGEAAEEPAASADEPAAASPSDTAPAEGAAAEPAEPVEPKPAEPTES